MFATHSANNRGLGDYVDVSGELVSGVDPNLVSSGGGNSFGGSLASSSVIAPISSPNASNWLSILGFGLKNIAAPILNSQFGGPKPGQYFASTPQGNIAYALPAGSSAGITNPFGALTTSSFSSLIPLAIGGILLVVLLKAFSK